MKLYVDNVLWTVEELAEFIPYYKKLVFLLETAKEKIEKGDKNKDMLKYIEEKT